MKVNAPLAMPQGTCETAAAGAKETNENKGSSVNLMNPINSEKRGRRGRPRKTEAACEKTVKAERGIFPVCDEGNCHAWQFGRCNALWNNDFGGRRCPFYKPVEVCRREQKDGLTKLIENGRMDLVEKYKTVLSDLGVFDMEDGYTDRVAADLASYSEQYLQELLAEAETQASEKATQESGSTQDGGDEWDDE